MQEQQLVRENKGVAIKRITKLVEAVNNSSRLFASAAAATDVKARMQRFAEKIHTTAEQFEFELRTELKRLAAEPVVVSHSPDMNLQLSLDVVLESYRQALASNITAHARAMITRQFEEMRRAYEEFASIYHVA